MATDQIPLTTHPSYARKLASLIELYMPSSTGNPSPASGSRVGALVPDEFYQDYFYPNSSRLIVEGLMTDWRPLTKWTLPWLAYPVWQPGRSKCMQIGLSDPKYEQHSRAIAQP